MFCVVFVDFPSHECLESEPNRNAFGLSKQNRARIKKPFRKALPKRI